MTAFLGLIMAILVFIGLIYLIGFIVLVYIGFGLVLYYTNPKIFVTYITLGGSIILLGYLKENYNKIYRDLKPKLRKFKDSLRKLYYN
jgi:hypothetical protein